MEIATPNLKLVLQSPAELLAAIEAMEPAARAEVSPIWLARVRALTEPDPWTCGFSVVHAQSGDVVGQCGYKGPPDGDGVVEIAYGVNEDQRGRGYATEAARALVEHALSCDGVRVVRAHTTPDNAPSIRVLGKSGLRQVGKVVDPEDGLVLRWETHRAGA